MGRVGGACGGEDFCFFGQVGEDKFWNEVAKFKSWPGGNEDYDQKLVQFPTMSGFYAYWPHSY